MPRLESTTHFWEANLEGATLQRSYGKRGTKGRTYAKSFGSKTAARHALREEQAEKRAEGYLEVAGVPDDAPIEMHELDLDRRLASDPSDAGSALVYADWLQMQGEPRGELIMVQHTLLSARGPDAKRLRDELDRLLKQHSSRFLGDVAEIENLFELKWRLGFIQEARVIADRSKRVKDVLKRLFKSPNLSRLLPHLVVDLFDLRSARFLEGLSLESVGGRDFETVLELVERRAPETLRRLCIPFTDYLAASLGVLKDIDNNRGAELGYSIGDYADAGIEVGKRPLHLPNLSELIIGAPIAFTGEVPGLSILASSSLPNLEVVELNCSARRSDLEHVRPLLDTAKFPKLRELRLKGARFARDITGYLLRSEMMQKLEVIDLSYGTLDDPTAMAIAGAKKDLPSLRRFTVHRTGLSRSSLEALRGAGLEVDLPIPAPPSEGPITDDRVRGMCEDERVESAARELADVKHWPEVGRDKFRMWGRIYAGRIYKVIVHLPLLNASCDCPSRKQPCKHALALMFLAADERIPEAKKPNWFY